VRCFAAHEWPEYRDLRLRSLGESPEAFGSTLAREEGRDDAHWQARLAEGVASATNHPVVAEDDGVLVGLAWGRIEESEPEVAHLYQMWLAPEARRLGLGRLLLDDVISWARTTTARRLVLGVTGGDRPARRLYDRAGFQPIGEPEEMREGLLGQEMELELNRG